MGEHEASARARTAGERQRNGAPGAGRGRAGAAGTALAVVAVAGTALGAMLLRPERSLLAKSGGPLDSTPVVILIALACLAAGPMLSSRYRARLGYEQNLPPLEQRLADVVRVTLIAAAVLIPIVLLTMHRFPPSGPTPPDARPSGGTPLTPTHRPIPAPKAYKPTGGPQFSLPHIVELLGVAVLVIVLLVAGYRLWRQLRPAPATPLGYRPATEQDLLAEAVDSGRRALFHGTDARAAVIACYAAMETSLADSGVARRVSDSPQDLLERAAGSGLLTGPHAGALTALFREARYSTHPMDGAHRDRAAAALDAIAAQLIEHADADGTRPDGGAPGPQPTAGVHR
ncbi:DUF4129 domain-containing protein [Streptomyces sp. IBSBF 2435]|uniref:DUF4129 domain-containing protein n=1 Tax=Streptomyces sp. IBSBF 2435 TaxID=2903531 RepID=UPI002FDBB32C